MKKIIVAIIIIILVVMSNNIDAIKIPDEAIRVRVIANSNSEYDQNIKLKVKDMLELKLYNLLKNTHTVNDARRTINDNLNNIDNSIYDVLKQNNYDLDYKINFGQNYFPEKEYKGIKYDEGYYESLVVTLGSGEGDNWWCILFPPLCLIEAEESEEVEYKFLVSELLEKYF